MLNNKLSNSTHCTLRKKSIIHNRNRSNGLLTALQFVAVSVNTHLEHEAAPWPQTTGGWVGGSHMSLDLLK